MTVPTRQALRRLEPAAPPQPATAQTHSSPSSRRSSTPRADADDDANQSAGSKRGCCEVHAARPEPRNQRSAAYDARACGDSDSLPAPHGTTASRSRARPARPVRARVPPARAGAARSGADPQAFANGPIGPSAQAAATVVTTPGEGGGKAFMGYRDSGVRKHLLSRALETPDAAAGSLGPRTIRQDCGGTGRHGAAAEIARRRATRRLTGSELQNGLSTQSDIAALS